MKYYSLRYVGSLPKGFGGKVSMWRIEILRKYKGDAGLLEHEKWHVRQWWAAAVTTLLLSALLAAALGSAWLILGLLAPATHTLLYKIKPYRKWSEARGYRIQLDAQRYASSQFAVDAMMHKYGLGLSDKEARKLIGA